MTVPATMCHFHLFWFIASTFLPICVAAPARNTLVEIRRNHLDAPVPPPAEPVPVPRYEAQTLLQDLPIASFLGRWLSMKAGKCFGEPGEPHQSTGVITTIAGEGAPRGIPPGSAALPRCGRLAMPQAALPLLQTPSPGCDRSGHGTPRGPAMPPGELPVLPRYPQLRHLVIPAENRVSPQIPLRCPRGSAGAVAAPAKAQVIRTLCGVKGCAKTRSGYHWAERRCRPL